MMLALLSGCTKSPDIPNVVNDEPFVSSVPSVTDISSTPEAIAATPEMPIEAVHQRNIKGTLQIAFLDVGQGDSIFISLPNGESILIDAGESSESGKIIQFIKENNGNTAIDYLIATHPHADHIGGMSSVIQAFDVRSVWMPDTTHNTRTFENLLDTIEEKDLLIDTAKAGAVLFDFGNLKAEFVAPNKDRYGNLNNFSAVLLLTYDSCRFLFMGDAEEESEKEILAAEYDIAADVLKAGHHGSKTSSSKSFIQRVNPKYAVISCGKDNTYGHPANETLAILIDFDIDIIRTDESGIIIFSSDGNEISYKAFKTEVQPRAPNTILPQITDSSAAKETQVEKVQKKNATVYVTDNGKKYHADGCRYLNQSKIPMDLEAAKQKYNPCSVCNPPR